MVCRYVLRTYRPTNKKEPYGFSHRAQIEDLENLKEFYDS